MGQATMVKESSHLLTCLLLWRGIKRLLAKSIHSFSSDLFTSQHALQLSNPRFSEIEYCPAACHRLGGPFLFEHILYLEVENFTHLDSQHYLMN
jgi:hypothetical protein